MPDIRNIWLDVDPGHDDATAILLAIHCPNINLLGISTVHTADETFMLRTHDIDKRLVRIRVLTRAYWYILVSPLDDKLEKAIRELHKTTRTADKMLQGLHDQGFVLGRTKMFEYKKLLGLETARKPMRSDGEQTQIILKELERDPKRANGPAKVWENLRLDGVQLKRDKVAQVMQDYEPEGFASRVSGKKVIHRTPLVSLGPDEEWSMDGHDKLAKAGFGVYGVRDKFAGKYLHYRVVPSNRYAAVVGILLLECAIKYGRICIQGTTDFGSEIRDSRAIHAVLREMFAPDLIDELIPSWRCTESYRNITVERSWRPLFEKWGVNMLEFHNAGLFGGVFEAGNDFHVSLKNWIWFPLLQRSLDRFTNQQNHHHIRRQPKKQLPSDGSAEEFYTHPERYGGEQCGIPIDVAFAQRVLDDMMAESGHLMEYVDRDFDELADSAYKLIGSPEITEQSAWRVFRDMLQKMTT